MSTGGFFPTKCQFFLKTARLLTNFFTNRPRSGRIFGPRVLMIASQKTLLIVDDSEMDREIIRHWLTRGRPDAYRILEVESSEAALELCEISRIDCILLDLELPGMSGIEFMADLNGRHGALCWPVVMLTGLGTEQTAVEAMKLGALDFIVKGNVNADNLPRAVERAIERKAAEHTREKELDDLRTQVADLRRESRELSADLREKQEEVDRLSTNLLKQLEGSRSSASAKF